MADTPARLTGGTAAAWAASSYKPLNLEPVVARLSDGTVDLRIGDGVHLFAALPSVGGEGGGPGSGDTTVEEFDMADSFESARAAAAGG